MLKTFFALRALVEEFEDVNKLSTSENGSLLLQLIKVGLLIVFLHSILHSTNIGSGVNSLSL